MAERQVVLVRWGERYGPEYVNRMYSMVRRNLTGELRVVCLTDNPAGIRPEVICEPLPELGCPHPVNTNGKWRKQILWGAEVPGLQPGPALFIDLDTVIVGPLDEYFTYGEPQDVILARNWAKPRQRLGQTSIFRFPVGGNPYVLEDFRANPQEIADRHQFEQHYVTSAIRGGVKFWPEEWTRHFRLHCLPPFPLRYWRTARLPKGARVITFPGGPNPDDVQDGRWQKTVPKGRSLLQHILATFVGPRASTKRLRHLQRYVLPVPWIAEHWRE